MVWCTLCKSSLRRSSCLRKKIIAELWQRYLSASTTCWPTMMRQTSICRFNWWSTNIWWTILRLLNSKQLSSQWTYFILRSRKLLYRQSNNHQLRKKRRLRLLRLLKINQQSRLSWQTLQTRNLSKRIKKLKNNPKVQEQKKKRFKQLKLSSQQRNLLKSQQWYNSSKKLVLKRL